MRNSYFVFIASLYSLANGAQAQEQPLCSIMPADTRSYQCMCAPGDNTGSVWGSGPYTADSSICAAGVHAGVIDEAGGPVLIIRRPGRDSYEASTANGITTRNWGEFEYSIDVRVTKRTTTVDPIPAEPSVARCEGFPAGAATVECSCPANAPAGSVWGSDPFTTDSDLCTAARHVGYVDETGGVVRAIRIQGLERYVGTTLNDIETRDWGSYSESFVFDWNN